MSERSESSDGLVNGLDYEQQGPPLNAAGPLDNVAWDQMPPHPEENRFLKIHTPKAGGGGVIGWFVSPYLTGVYTHWYGGRTGPCLQPKRVCEGCRMELRRVQKGYAIFVTPGMTLGLLEVTSEVLRQSPALMQTTANLTGRSFRAVRPGQSKFGMVRLTVGPPAEAGCEAVEGLDPKMCVRSALAKIWGFSPTSGQK